ncbi:lipid A 3-O-deacylase [Oxalobacteraceae bacterium GrIS 1.18]
MLKKILAFILISSVTPLIWADVSVEAGAGSQVAIYKLALQKNWENDYTYLREHHIHGYWELNVAEIEARKFDNIPGRRQYVTDFGVTPVLRWQEVDQHGWFAEIGVGAHYFSKKYDNDRRAFSTNFQFGDHAGIGYQFNDHFEVTVKFQHYSNADIKKPNPGVNVGMLKLAYAF